MKKVFSLLFCLMFMSYTFSQKRDRDVKIVEHTVKADETVLKISKMYQVDPSEVYRNNRKALDGVSSGMVLQIPVSKDKIGKANPTIEVSEIKIEEKKKIEVVSEEKNPTIEIEKAIEKKSVEFETVVSRRKNSIQHKVVQGETLYGLSKKYNVSVNSIQEINTTLLKDGLKIGQMIEISSENELVANNVSHSTNKDTIIKHKVEPKETLYGLSKRYNVSVEEILNQNNEVKAKGLQIGQTLTIKTN